MRRPEQLLQQQVAEYLALAYPDLVWWHTANNARSAHIGGILKSMGVRAGVADLAFVLPNGQAAFLELKAKRGVLSEAQEQFAAAVIRSGGMWAMARSLTGAADILRFWLGPLGCPARATIAA